jgi:hypothetical protein
MYIYEIRYINCCCVILILLLCKLPKGKGGHFLVDSSKDG